MSLQYPIVADTVVDLTGNVLPDGWSYKLLGNLTKFDQPPTWYVYDASSTATPDGVTVLQPTMVTGAGRYIRRLDSYLKLTDTPVLATVATTGAYGDLSGRPSLATVATSGNYSDLSGKPSLSTVAISGSYNDLTNLPPARSFSVPSRALNSAAFQISASRDALVSYSIQISATISLTTGQTGTVILQMSPTSGGTYATIGTLTNGNTGTLTIGLNLTQTQSAVLSCVIPAGYYVKLVSTGTATNTIVSQQEVLL